MWRTGMAKSGSRNGWRNSISSIISMVAAQRIMARLYRGASRSLLACCMLAHNSVGIAQRA